MVMDRAGVILRIELAASIFRLEKVELVPNRVQIY